MLKIRNEDLRDCLKKIGVQFVWLSDTEYIRPKIEEVKSLIENKEPIKYGHLKITVASVKYIPSIQDCDDFALHLNSDIKRVRGALAARGKILIDECLPWAVGECFGIKFNGYKKQHNANIAYCEEGFFLIEPQTNDVWNFNQDNDNILLVRM